MDDLHANPITEEGYLIKRMEVEIINTVIINMATQKKLIDYRRSIRDQSMFEISYPISSTITELQLFPNVTLSQFVKTGEVICYVQEGEGIKNSVEAPLSGIIVQMRTQGLSNLKGKSVHILTIKGCEHFPKDKIQSGQEKQVLLNKSILQTADSCAYCGQPLWFYYEKKQNQVTYRELKRSFEKFNVDQFDWRVQIGEQFTKDTQIGNTNEQNYYILGGGKITYLYQFSIEGQPHQDSIVLKYKNVVCKHEKISSGMCVFCLTDVKSLKNVNLRRYLFQFDEQNYDSNIILTGHSLESQVQQFKNKIIQHKKCVLILDLDNTILHSISLKKVDKEMLNSIEEYAIIPSQENSSIFVEKTLVKFRPNFEYFLQKIVDMYEIFIYTKGTRPYAQQICRVVRENYKHIVSGTKNFQSHRIISRDEDPSLQKKNLDYIIPKNRQFMLILDDRRDVWNHSPLCLFTRAYIFFYYVEMTSDGHTKLAPVEWDKGGGTIEHKLNQFQQKCLNQIKQAEDHGNKVEAAQIMHELQKQIVQIEQKQKQQDEKIIVCVPDANTLPNQKPQIEQQDEVKKQIIAIIHNKKTQQKKNILLRSNCNPDQYLITTLFALKQSHMLYFQKYALPDDENKKEGKYVDLCTCFQEYKKSLLNHLVIGYIFINRDYKKLGCYRRAQKMGLKVAENLSEHIDILIRPNNFMAGYSESSAELITKLYNEAVRKMKSISQTKKIPIVSETWIDVCYQFNCCVHHKYFEPQNPYDKIIYGNEHEMRRAVSQSTSVVAQKIKQIFKQSTQNTEFDLQNLSKDMKEQ